MGTFFSPPLSRSLLLSRLYRIFVSSRAKTTYHTHTKQAKQEEGEEAGGEGRKKKTGQSPAERQGVAGSHEHRTVLFYGMVDNSISCGLRAPILPDWQANVKRSNNFGSNLRRLPYLDGHFQPRRVTAQERNEPGRSRNKKEGEVQSSCSRSDRGRVSFHHCPQR